MDTIQKELINSINEFIMQYRKSLSNEDLLTLKKYTLELRKGNFKSTDSRPDFFIKTHQCFLIIIDLTIWNALMFE